MQLKHIWHKNHIQNENRFYPRAATTKETTKTHLIELYKGFAKNIDSTNSTTHRGHKEHTYNKHTQHIENTYDKVHTKFMQKN
jgi:hypothetical protein